MITDDLWLGRGEHCRSGAICTFQIRNKLQFYECSYSGPKEVGRECSKMPKFSAHTILKYLFVGSGGGGAKNEPEWRYL